MINYKLANANSARVTVTGTATSLKSLIDTAGSTANNLPAKIDAVLLSVESGSARFLYDNTPTSELGMPLVAGRVYPISGIFIDKLYLVGDAVINIDFGELEK